MVWLRIKKRVVWLSKIPLFNNKRPCEFGYFPMKQLILFFKDQWATPFKQTVILRFVYRFFCLFVPSVAPQFIEIPDKVTKVTGNSVASLSCRALGFPPPTVVWSRGLVPLPQGRSTVTNGTLIISNFSPGDAGPYQCKATNKLGSVSALTTLNYFPPGMSR